MLIQMYGTGEKNDTAARKEILTSLNELLGHGVDETFYLLDSEHDLRLV